MSGPRPPSDEKGAILGGLLIELGFLSLTFSGDLRRHLTLFMVIYAAQFALMVIAFMRPEGLTPRKILAFALLFRFTLLPTTPSLSDDIYRYGWEGRVQRAGWSPYEYPPSAPELAFLRDAAYPLINHNAVPTVYPPLTQLGFRLGSYLSDLLRRLGLPLLRAAVLGQKLFFVFFDLMCIGGILELLRRRGLPAHHALLYAWNPLVILEFAGSGHNDSLGIFYLLIGLACWEKGKPLWATLGLAASFLSKYLSILLIPFFLWKKKWKELAIWALFVAGGLAPFCFCWIMVHGVTHYAAQWQFNGSLFVLLDKLSPKPEWAKWAVGGLLGIFAMGIGKKEADLTRSAYLLILASLLLAPTVHPWYVIWLIPFLCLFPSPALAAWNLTIILSYTVWRRYAHDHVWTLHPAVQFLEYLPVYTLLMKPSLLGIKGRDSETRHYHPRSE